MNSMTTDKAPKNLRTLTSLATGPHTTLAAWPLAISRALEANHIDPMPLLQAADIDLQHLRNNPDDRVDVSKMTVFWDLLEKATEDPSFGLKVARYVQPMHFRALGLLMFTTSRIEIALEKLAEYHSLVSNSADITLTKTPERIGFAIKPLPAVTISEMAIDSFYATIVHFINQLTQSQHYLEKVQLIRMKPDNPNTWSKHFECPVEFGCEQNCLWIYRAKLQQDTFMGDEQLAAQNEQAVQHYLANRLTIGWAEKVRLYVLTHLDQGEPPLIEIAEHYSLGERTLRRHLQDEDTSFRQILQVCRIELAQHYLLKTTLSITEISYRLGFKDTSNFSRAFQRWLNASPSEYRQANSQPSNE